MFDYQPDEINIVARSLTVNEVLSKTSASLTIGSSTWDSSQKSRLIESILIRVPLQCFYLDTADSDRWVIIDGFQRLCALKEFIDNNIHLSGIEYLHNEYGKTYDELNPRYQRRILETYLHVNLIEKGTPLGIKYNIFERLNIELTNELKYQKRLSRWS